MSEPLLWHTPFVDKVTRLVTYPWQQWFQRFVQEQNPAHLLATGSPPTITPGPGLGAGGSGTIEGTDATGLVTLTTAGTPVSNAILVVVTFAVPYKVRPVVLLQPANSAAWALVFAATQGLRLLHADTTLATWTLRSGPMAFPTGVATYQYTYHVLGNAP